MDPVDETLAALRTRLVRWVDAGLISRAQADVITGWETVRQDVPPAASAVSPRPQSAGSMRPASGPKRSVAVEALVYLGGAIIVAALIVVTAGYWHLLTHTVRLMIPGAATVALLIAGALIPQRLGLTMSRARATTWLVSAVTLAVLLIVAMDSAEVVGDTAALVTGAVLTVYTLLLWLVHRTASQQLAAFASAGLLAAALAVRVPGEAAGLSIGTAFVVLAALWGLLAWRGWLPGARRWLDPEGQPADQPASANRREYGAVQRRWGVALAAVGASVGASILAAQPDLPWLGVLVIALAVSAAIVLADLIMLAIAAVGALVTLPIVVDHYFSSTLSVALVLLATGAVLVGLAVLVARRRTASGSTQDENMVNGGAMSRDSEQVSGWR